MNKIKNFKYITPIIYFLNYSTVLSAFLSTIFLANASGGFLFIMSLLFAVVLYIIDLLFIEKWYNYALCTAPFVVGSIYGAIETYIKYNFTDFYNCDFSSIEVLLAFVFFHFCASVSVSLTVFGSMFIHRFRNEISSKSSKKIYTIAIVSYFTAVAVQFILSAPEGDFLLKQSVLSNIFLVVFSILIIIIFACYKLSKATQLVTDETGESEDKL